MPPAALSHSKSRTWTAWSADLKAKGVKFKSDIIHGPKCRMAVCLDSEGNSLLLHQLKPKSP